MKSFVNFSYSIFTIFLAVSLIFFIVRLAPGDPVEKILGPEASAEEVSKYRDQLGLNDSFGVQYKNYLFGLIKLDLGKSLFKKKPVVELIKGHMQSTSVLALTSVALSTIIGIFIGVLAAKFKSRPIDGVIRVLTLVLLSFPIFSLAPILVYFFAIKFQLFPVSEWGELKHAMLPIITLVIPLSAVLGRVTRNAYLEATSAPWILVLKSKGLSDVSIRLRVLKSILPSILNVVAIQLSVVLAGTMITETIFDIPGIGSLLFAAIQARDYPIVQGVIAYSTLIYMLVYFVIDFLNAKIDPRIKT